MCKTSKSNNLNQTTSLNKTKTKPKINHNTINLHKTSKTIHKVKQQEFIHAQTNTSKSKPQRKSQANQTLPTHGQQKPQGDN